MQVRLKAHRWAGGREPAALQEGGGRQPVSALLAAALQDRRRHLHLTA